MADLKTDYKDDVLDTSVNSKRTFNIVDQDGNIIFENVTLNDTTVYSQIGDSFGALDINSTNEAIEQVNSDLGKKQDASTALRTDGKNASINPVSDLNNFYTGEALFDANTLNIPSKTWYKVSSAGDAGTRVQVAIALGDGTVFIRKCAAKEWGEWGNGLRVANSLKKIIIGRTSNTSESFNELKFEVSDTEHYLFRIHDNTDQLIVYHYADGAYTKVWNWSNIQSQITTLKSDLTDIVTTATTAVSVTAVPGSAAKLPLKQPTLNGYKVVTNKAQQIKNKANVEMYEINNSYIDIIFTNATSQTVTFTVEWLMIRDI